MATSESDVRVPVGFTQQQQQLIERLKHEGIFGREDGEVVHAVFAEWLKEERTP